MMSEQAPIVLDLQVLQKSRCVELTFNDGLHATLPIGFLRINSPSAAVQGHGHVVEIKPPPQESNVNITAIDPVGNYAVKFHFDDGHNTGLFTWEYLYALSKSLV